LKTVRFWWGMIHGHSELSDGAGNLRDYFSQLRDECALDFGALSDHDHLFETEDEHCFLENAASKSNSCR